MNELSLFSGFGGFSLGLRLAGLDVQTVAYVEIDPYCQKVLKARMQDGHLDNAPIWPDIRAFSGEQCRGVVDIITAGFPCQPHSVAGKRAGALDDRNLWPDTLRVISEVGPGIVLLENVPGILANGYAGTVVGQLASAGYDALWGLLSASGVGAPHVRTRWWCLAYPNRFRARESGWRGDTLGAFLREIQGRGHQEDSQNPGTPADNGSTVAQPTGTGWPTRPSEGESGGCGTMAHATGQRLEGGSDGEERFQTEASGLLSPGPGEPSGGCWWATEPPLGRVAHGVAHRVDRLKALGNGVVPAVVAEFLRLVAL